MDQILNDISVITRKPLFICCRIGFASLALENVLEFTRKFLQRSHLVFSHLKQPGAGISVLGKELFLPLEGARISSRIF